MDKEQQPVLSQTAANNKEHHLPDFQQARFML
jgi:hypothetical protein